MTEPDKSPQKSTADSWNRLRDQEKIEGELGLSEHGGTTDFYAKATPDLLVAKGYDRVVYGDHGAYIEFSHDKIVWAALPKAVKKSELAYYDEFYSACGTVKLYDQKKTVADKKNPPAGGISRNREGGYADYKVGFCYISPKDLTVKEKPKPAVNKPKRWGKK